MSFFSPFYWLTTEPPEVGGTLGTIVFIVFLACLVLGIVSRISADRRREDRYVREIGRRVSFFLTSMGVWGVVLFFFSFENIYLFGARFWYPVWGIVFLVWSYRIVKYVREEVPEMRELDQERKARNKYLPKRKR